MKSTTAFLIVSLFSIGLFAQDVKLPVPSDADVRTALASLKDAFKDKYQNLKTPEDRRMLAEKLLEQAADPSNTPAMAYALITESARIAGEAGDIATIEKASTLYAGKFDGDAVAFRKKMLEAAEKTTPKQTPEALSLLAEDDIRRTAEKAKDLEELLKSEKVDGENMDDILRKATDTKLRQEELAKLKTEMDLKKKDLELKKVEMTKSQREEARKCFLADKMKFSEIKINEQLSDTTKTSAWQMFCTKWDLKADPDAWRTHIFVWDENSDAPTLKKTLKTLREEEQIHIQSLKAARAKFNAEAETLKAILELPDQTDEMKKIKWTEFLAKWDVSASPDSYKTHCLVWHDNLEKPKLSGLFYPSKSCCVVDLKTGEQVKLDSDPPGLLSDDVYKTTKIVFRRIPAGEFTMGSPANEDGRDNDEPQHEVTLTKDFYIGVFEITQAQWKTIMGSFWFWVSDNPSKFKGAGPKAPLENVSWTDCQAFIEELNGKKSSALVFRLPTEAEWEYACRAGTANPYNDCTKKDGAGDNADLANLGWFSANSDGKTHEVGLKQANAWGLYDMHGNVWEWCSDLYGQYPSGAATNTTGAASGAFRVFRGGSWGNDAGYCRSASRGNHGQSDRHNRLGFRLAFASPEVLENENIR